MLTSLKNQFNIGCTQPIRKDKLWKLSKKKQGDTLTCSLFGRLDTNTSPELLEQINLDGVQTLIIDLADVDYVFSAGLRVFLQLQKNMNEKNGQMTLINMQDSVKEIFKIVGFTNIMDIK